MKRLLARAAFAVACVLGLHHLARRLNRRRLLVVCYHGVWEGRRPEGWPEWHLVDAADFRRQLAYLARHYDVLPVDEALERLRAGALSRPTACITFDDGYLNNRTVALEPLREHATPATVYLATGLVGTPRRLWTVRLEAALLQYRGRTLELTELGWPELRLGGTVSRRALAHRLIERLKGIGPAERDRLLAVILASLGDAPAPDEGAFEMMGWADADALSATGLVRFGAHTVNHEIVSTLSDAELASELSGSVAAVAERPLRVTRTFAYPNGRPEDFDGRAGRLLRELGVMGAFSTIEGLNEQAVDAFAMRRVLVSAGTSFAEFRLSTAGALAMFRRLRGRARRVEASR